MKIQNFFFAIVFAGFISSQLEAAKCGCGGAPRPQVKPTKPANRPAK